MSSLTLCLFVLLYCYLLFLFILTLIANVFTGLQAKDGIARIDVYLDIYFASVVILVQMLNIPYYRIEQMGWMRLSDTFRTLTAIHMLGLFQLPFALIYLMSHLDDSIPGWCRTTYWYFAITIWVIVLGSLAFTCIYEREVRLWSSIQRKLYLVGVRCGRYTSKNKRLERRLIKKIISAGPYDSKAVSFLPELQDLLAYLDKHTFSHSQYAEVLTYSFAKLLSFDPRRSEYAKLVPRFTAEEAEEARKVAKVEVTEDLNSSFSSLLKDFGRKQSIEQDISPGLCSICHQVLCYKSGSRPIEYQEVNAPGGNLVFACLESGTYKHLSCAIAKNRRFFLDSGKFDLYRQALFPSWNYDPNLQTYFGGGGQNDIELLYEPLLVEAQEAVVPPKINIKNKGPSNITTKLDIILRAEEARKEFIRIKEEAEIKAKEKKPENEEEDADDYVEMDDSLD